MTWFKTQIYVCAVQRHTTCGPALATGVQDVLKAKWACGTNQQLQGNAQLFPFPEMSGNQILFLRVCVCTTRVRLVSVNIVQYVESFKIKYIICASFDVCCSQLAPMNFHISLQI